MRRHDGTILHSASDLVAFLGCEHSITLALQDLDARLPRAADDASAALIKDKGFEHERAVLADFEAQGLRVAQLSEHGDPAALAAEAVAALRSGADVVYQATLVGAPFYGRTDFLRRVERPSDFGDFSYEVVDTKLARRAKAEFVVQLAVYSELLEKVQGVLPGEMHVTLGDRTTRSLRVADYRHYVDQARMRFLAFVQQRPATYPQRCQACSTCAWRDLCAERWRADDHPNQVAGITRNQIDRLASAQVRTVAQLAALSPEAAVPRLAPELVAKLQAQAALQVERRTTGQPKMQLLPLDDERRRGFHRLPQPDPGDIFFDMEGDPLEEGGLEYLFGVRYDDHDGAGPKFRAFWAHDRAQERRAFEDFIDFVVERRQRHPRLHVYHYAHYERHALERLMTSHGTREAQLDDLLRAEVLVDLYKVVREGMLTSEAGLSIKDLEVFYMPPREGDIRDAGASIVHYERWRHTQDPAELDRIRDYNDDDCRSTQLLRGWLLGLRPEGMPWFERTPPDDEKKDRDRSDSVRAIEDALESYRLRLVAGIPEQDAHRSDDERFRALVFHLLDFHRRADKPQWWAVFARRDLTDAELEDDVECLGNLVPTATPPSKVGRSGIYEYRYPDQETKLREGKDCWRCDTAEPLGKIEALDAQRQLVRLRISDRKEVPARLSIGPAGPIKNHTLREAVWRVGDAVIAGDARRFRAALAFLRRDAPSLRGRPAGAPVVTGDADLAVEALRAVEALQESYLFIQGPPGAGKTTIGSRLIVDLLRAGKRVGVTSNSHKAIHNLLDAVEARAAALGVTFDGVKKSSSRDPDSAYSGRNIQSVDSNDEIFAGDPRLIAGTAWLFADPGLEGFVDYLFVDEAGQVSLANLMAAGTAARNLVLLGDQMQLGQPIQGDHPGRSGESALEYLLDGRATVPADRGIFLPTSYRMHEDVCRFISRAIYDDRLHAEPGNQARRLVLDATAHPALRPTGIRFHGVEHRGCRQRCRAEADALREIVGSLLTQKRVAKDGSLHPVALDDVLVVAPYNSQVNLLRELLPEGMRVGTIDKFQGQEAPVVLVSMTTSSGEDLPRNLEFLYDRNRLNVAVSRAQCLAVVVASPALLHADCHSPEQMALVNTLCWLKEYAEAMPAYPA